MSVTDGPGHENRALRAVRRAGWGLRRLMVFLMVATVFAPTVTACSASDGSGGTPPAGTPSSAGAGGSSGGAGLPVDIRPLLRPRNKYWGAALPGAPRSLTPVNRFSDLVGKRPNILEYYVAWGDQFDLRPARNAWSSHAIPFLTWEPFTTSVAKIAMGGSDAYITRFAGQVRDANLPVAISFGHEMNGFWYPWGTKTTTAAQFVAAWRRVHDLFTEAGAGNVIWVWSANVVNPVPRVPLQPLYPGDSYVDWIGMVGYYTAGGADTFEALYGPTMTAVRRFTRKPFLISETAVEPGPHRASQIADLIAGVRANPDVIGFIWFDHVKRADWRLTAAPSGVPEFRRQIADSRLGVDVNPVA